MAHHRLTVTQLKCAALDPEWRRRWRAGEDPATPRPRTPNGSLPVKGKLFHTLVEHFTDWLCHGRARQTARRLTTPDDLWRECYARFAESKLDALAQAGEVESACHLSDCLQAFCTRLSKHRQECVDFSDWQDLFLGGELAIEDTQIGQTGVYIRGRVDAVRRDPRHGLAVVDYKLSRGGEAEHDLIQLSIYAHLLETTRPGLGFTGLLEYYEPDLTVVEVTAGELRDLFQDMVLPVVRELTATGETPRPATATRPPAPEPVRPDPRDESDLSERIADTFAAFKLKVDIVGRITAPQLVRYQARPVAGVKVVSLANRAEDLQVRLALPMPPRIEPAQGYVTIDVPKDEPDTVWWRDIQGDPEFGALTSRVAFPIGMGVEGRLLLADFADSKTCHALVAGTSGSGKSEFLRSMAASLIRRNAPQALHLTLIDPKVLTFGDMQSLPHLTGPIISQLGDAISCLEQAVGDMESRYQQLGREGFANLGQRINAGQGDLPFRVIVFDEFADLVLAGKKEKTQFETLVTRLASKGRAAGIHLILATQRPDRTIVTGPIKANLPLKICLRVTNSTNSQIILDEPGGETLVGRGDLLCDRGKGIERAQSPFLQAADLQGLITQPQGQ